MSITQLLPVETHLVGRIVTTNVETDTLTIYASFEDKKTGEAREPQSTTRLFELSIDTERAEFIYGTHTTTGGITTITVPATGRKLNKYGIMSGGATGFRHPINQPVGCATSHLPVEQINQVLDGTLGSGANILRIGDETASDIYIYAQNDQANKPFLKYDEANSKWVFSNDGTSSTDVGGGTGTITAGDGIDIAAGVVSVDLKADSGLVIDTTELKLDIRGNYGLLADANGLYIDLKTNGGLEFDTGQLGINFASGGGLEDTGSGAQLSGTADVSVSKTFVSDEILATGDAVANIPYQNVYRDGFTTGDIQLGDLNANRRHAVKFTPKVTSSDLATMKIVGREVLASTITLTVSIQGDNAGEPDGVDIANGTANTLDTSAWTATYAERTVTWAAPPTLTKGTTYWLVFASDKTDAANHIEIASTAMTEFERPNWTRKTYDLDAGTWGSSTTTLTDIPFFYFPASDQLGRAAIKTDANFLDSTFQFVGFVVTGVAADVDVTVSTQYGTGLTLTDGSPYHLSDTAGLLSTSAGTVPYHVGNAISSTDLEIKKDRILVGRNVALTTSGANSTTDLFEPVGFQMQHLEGFVGIGANTHIVITGGVALGGTMNHATWDYGDYLGFQYNLTGTTVSTATTSLAKIFDASNDTNTLTIENVTEDGFYFRNVDVDTCTIATMGIDYRITG